MDNVVATVINLIIWLSCTSAQQETIWYSPMSQAYNAVDTDWTVVANNFQFKEDWYCPNWIETPYCWQVCGENPNNDGYIYRIISTEYYQDIKLEFNVRPTDTWEGNAYCEFYYNINNNGDSNWIQFYQHGEDWVASNASMTLNIATSNNIGVGIKISAFRSDNDCCNLNEIKLIGTPMTQTPTYQPTEQPTTSQPTTTQPTTVQPTSQPTTSQPTTAQPTTAQPTTTQPTTSQPTTVQPTTAQPTTAQPTTTQPTTVQPTTSQPTTSQPTTTEPTTLQPTTSQPTTAQPTTSQPTTAPPTTSQPTTSIPTTSIPTTSIPTTPQPITSQPTTIQPTTAQPTTQQPSTAQPTTTNPTNSQTTATPTMQNPTNSVTTSQPTTSAPTTSQPTSRSPTTSAPSTTSPTHNTIILHPTLVVSLPTESSDYESSTSTHMSDSNEGLGADYAAIPFTNSDTFIGILCGALFLLTLLCITIAIKRWKNTNNKLLDRYDEGKLVSKPHFQQHEIVMSCTPTNTTTNTFDANLSHGHVTVGMPNVDNIDLHETTTDDDDDDDANLEYGEYGEFPRTLRNAATINTMVMDEIVNEMETTGQ